MSSSIMSLLGRDNSGEHSRLHMNFFLKFFVVFHSFLRVDSRKISIEQMMNFRIISFMLFILYLETRKTTGVRAKMVTFAVQIYYTNKFLLYSSSIRLTFKPRLLQNYFLMLLVGWSLFFFLINHSCFSHFLNRDILQFI
jgi:hypothetical protein